MKFWFRRHTTAEVVKNLSQKEVASFPGSSGGGGGEREYSPPLQESGHEAKKEAAELIKSLHQLWIMHSQK